MSGRLFKKLLKAILLATPFFVMLMMVLALWGIGGKTIYSEQIPAMTAVKFTPGEAKNYLVNGIQSSKPPTEASEKPEVVVDEIKVPAPMKEPQPEKIKWELVV